MNLGQDIFRVFPLQGSLTFFSFCDERGLVVFGERRDRGLLQGAEGELPTPLLRVYGAAQHHPAAPRRTPIFLPAFSDLPSSRAPTPPPPAPTRSPPRSLPAAPGAPAARPTWAELDAEAAKDAAAAGVIFTFKAD